MYFVPLPLGGVWNFCFRSEPCGFATSTLGGGSKGGGGVPSPFFFACCSDILSHVSYRLGVAIDTAGSNQTEVYPRGAETPRAP